METHILHIPSHHSPWFSIPKKRLPHVLAKTLLSAVILQFAVLLGVSAYIWWRYDTIILPNTSIHSVPVGRLTPEEAHSALESQELLDEYLIRVTTPEQEFATSSAWLELTAHTEEAVQEAAALGHTGSLFQQVWVRWQSLLGREHTVALPYTYNADKLERWIESLDAALFIAGAPPAALPVGNTYQLEPGEHGQKLNREKLTEQILATAGSSAPRISAPIEITHTPLRPDALQHSEQRLDALSALSLELVISEAEPTRTLTKTEFFPWLRLPEGFHEATMSADLQTLTADWNRPAQNAVFELENETTVKEFQPDRPGREVLLTQLITDVQMALQSRIENDDGEEPTNTIKITVPVKETAADITLEETNSLGIKELLGRGTSTFHGSIPNRVYNVALTSERIHGTLVPAGEEFSFNRAVGPVNGSTGFRSAYVIQNGRTELGDGGGVCQGSTTVFRAILDAGFPVTQWKAHSYRVGYYEQNTEPGFDATVYAPSVDLRFKNDSEHAIIIATQVDVPNRHLVVEIWGTSDGRSSEISDYRIWNQRPAPAPLYQDEPTLPAGTTKQIDWATPGANTEFTYTVTDAEGNEMYQREFTSYFRPWQAIYLVGTGG